MSFFNVNIAVNILEAKEVAFTLITNKKYKKKSKILDNIFFYSLNLQI